MSVFGPRSLGRSPYLERGAFRGSGHVSYDRSGHAVEQNALRNKSKIYSNSRNYEKTKKSVNNEPNYTIPNLPEPTSVVYETFGQKIPGLPKSEFFNQMYSGGGSIPFQETNQGPFTIPDGSGLPPRNKKRSRNRSRNRSQNRSRGRREPTPIQIVKKEGCGSSECNLYWDVSKKQYISDSLSSCTCCSIGKKCRNDEFSPQGVRYNDCCTGLQCSSVKGSLYGSCK
jgi:hypothetical protein